MRHQLRVNGPAPAGRPSARFDRRRPRRLTVLLCALLIAACAVTGEPSVTAPPGATTTVPRTTLPTAPASSTTTIPPTTACPEGDVMLTDGQLLAWERPTADAARVAEIGWRLAGDCQVLTVSFATGDGAPATTPPTLSASLLRSAGVLRIESAASSSVVTDQLVEHGLVERIFVPVDADGNRFIDLVLNAPVVGRARLLTSPARLELELQSGGPEDLGSPLVTDEIVLVEPALGATVEPVIDVTGYSIGTAAGLNVSVLMAGTAIEEANVELVSQPGVWTAFSLTIPVGDRPYDRLQVETPDGSILAGIPFTP